jgi:hypothetical protein
MDQYRTRSKVDACGLLVFAKTVKVLTLFRMQSSLLEINKRRFFIIFFLHLKGNQFSVYKQVFIIFRQ